MEPSSLDDVAADGVTSWRRNLPGVFFRARYTSAVPFAPEYVANVLNENFKDAKALFLAPLMAIHYAHLVMLADTRDRRPRRCATASARRWTAISLDEVRACAYDGTYEDLFFYVERLIVAGVRRRRRRPAAHRPQPQRHRHDDVPDAAAGVRLGAARRDACDCARSLLDLAESHRETVFAVSHAHTAGAADDGGALPAGGCRAARARRARGCVRRMQRRIAVRSARARSPGRGFPSTGS